MPSKVPNGVIMTKIVRIVHRRLLSAPEAYALTITAKAAEPLWNKMANMTSTEVATSASSPRAMPAMIEWIDKTTSRTRG